MSAGEFCRAVTANANWHDRYLHITAQSFLSNMRSIGTASEATQHGDHTSDPTDPLTVQLLNQCAIFDYQNIPLEVLKEGFDPIDDTGQSCAVFSTQNELANFVSRP